MFHRRTEGTSTSKFVGKAVGATDPSGGKKLGIRQRWREAFNRKELARYLKIRHVSRVEKIPLLAAFRRVSVADQACAVLRQAIQQGAVTDPLPGEHHLARQLGISRSSLRTAMAQLVSEGLVHRATGVRARLKSGRRSATHNFLPTVCVVCPMSRELFLRAQHPIVMEMHLLFATKGIQWEEAIDARLDVPHPEPQLRALVAGREHVCWLLLGCTAPIQRWFAEANLPAFTVGSCAADAALPSVDVDFRAVGWHAAGVMIKQGHRHVGLVHHRRLLVGDHNAFDGFLGYLARAAPETGVTRILIDSDYANLRAKITNLAATRKRPTALLCVRPALTLGAVVNLGRAGLRIPGDISVISRDSHTLIDASIPDVTRYSGVSMRLASRAVRVAQALIAGHYVPPRPSLVFPTFISGETLGPPP